MLTLISILTAHAAPYELDFGVVGVSFGSQEWYLQQELLDQLNNGVVDVDLSQFPGNPNLSWAQNDVSQLTYTSSAAILDGAPARALYYHLGNGVYECDMAVSTLGTWSTNDLTIASNQYGGPWRTLGSTMMHELGHCLRLEHNATEYNIMGIDFTHVSTNNGSLYFYLGEDAADRLVTLHDPVTSFQDVGVVHWRYAGNPDGDEYSDHERTAVLSTGYHELPSYTEAGGDIPVFLVRQGYTVRPEFTFENNGSTNNVTIDVDYRLSTNDYITGSDPLLASTSFSMGRDNVYTTARSVFIPASTAPGRYFLGARISDLVNLTDDVSANNATHIDIEVLEVGDLDFCLGPEPCQRFHGDCDRNADCADGLECIHNQGASYGFDPEIDVCDYPGIGGITF